MRIGVWPAATLVLLTTILAGGAARADDSGNLGEDVGRVSAIQNRKYKLDQEIAALVAFLPWDAFYKGLAVGGSYTFHFSDAFAWEVARAMYSFNSDTDLKTQLINLSTKPTSFEEVNFFITSDLVWSPVYYKGVLVNSTLFYGEFYGLLGPGAYWTSENKVRAAVNVGLGGRLFLSRTFSLRLEVRDSVLIETSPLNVLDIAFGVGLNFGGGGD
jgi:outer membrane beta-barrel protein